MKNALQFIRKTIWKIPLSDLPLRKAIWIKLCRIIILTCRGFINKRFAQAAAALTYYSILSIVPFIAICLGIAKGFGFEDALLTELLRAFPNQQEVFDNVVRFANKFLEHSQEGVIAGVGVAILLWTMINILRSIESSFNEIWGITKGRSPWRQITDYLAMILIGPFLFSMSNGINVFLAATVRLSHSSQWAFSIVGSLSYYLLKLFPALVLWFLFSFVYAFMPHTRVRISCAVAAGFVTTIFYYLAQWAYFSFQFAVTKYDAIYGGWAALPLFLIWVNLSWMIIVIGAKLTYAIQNAAVYEFEEERIAISPNYKQLLSLYIAETCVHKFCNDEPAPTLSKLTQELKMPFNLTKQIVKELVSAHILIESKNPETKEMGYMPATLVDRLTIKYVLDALNHSGSSDIPVPKTPVLDKIETNLAGFNQLLETSSANIKLKDL